MNLTKTTIEVLDALMHRLQSVEAATASLSQVSLFLDGTRARFANIETARLAKRSSSRSMRMAPQEYYQ